jgi:GT2 family glycosyltransferase
MLEELGGFDVSFFGYLEDVDLAWRARMAGWRALYEPTAVGYHHHSATFGHGSATKYFLVGRNRVRLLAKNATTRQLLKYGPWMLAYDIAYVAFVGTRRRTLAPLRGRLAGLRDWRAYRRAGARARRPVELAPVAGLSSALNRDRAWRAA